MSIHANARLGPAGRRELVFLIINLGMSERQAAACLSTSNCTAHRWKQRWLEARAQERASGSWALDRSSRPRSSPGKTSPEIERRVCEARARTGWGPRLIAGEVGVAHSTVHAILKRHGCSRAARAPRAQFVRYEWPCPGDLLHMTSSTTRAFVAPEAPSSAIAAGPRLRCTPALAMTASTRSSMITHGWPTASCSQTNAPPPSPPSSRAHWRGLTPAASPLGA